MTTSPIRMRVLSTAWADLEHRFNLRAGRANEDL
jgi:hypothetical protein